MSENASANQPSSTSKKFQYLNVILHGAFGYVFDNDAIRVYTPACFGHFYAAGGLNSLEELRQGVDYGLVGVKTPSPKRQTISPGGNRDPVISRKDVQLDRSDIDSLNIRYSMFELPYPMERRERPTLMCSALNEFVGEIYSGHPGAANPLNALEMVPSMHILVYEIADQQNCGLSPLMLTITVAT